MAVYFQVTSQTVLLRSWGALLLVRMSMKTEQSVPFLCSPASYIALEEELQD